MMPSPNQVILQEMLNFLDQEKPYGLDPIRVVEVIKTAVTIIKIQDREIEDLKKLLAKHEAFLANHVAPTLKENV